MKTFAFILIPILLFGTELDVGTTEIIFPKGRVRTWNWVPILLHPKTIVKNFGDTTVSFSVIFKIDNVAVDTQIVENLAPNFTDTVNFVCLVQTFGNHSVACSTCLEGDLHPENDKCVDSFNILPRDIGVAWINFYGNVPAGETIRPALTIRNFGGFSDNFPLILHIIRMVDTLLVYADTHNVLLNPGASRTVTFNPWIAEPVGLYKWWLRKDTIRIIIGDTTTIDSISGFFYVYSLGIEEITALPLAVTSGVDIYPNLAKTFFAVRIPQITDYPVVKIFDISGKVIKEVKVSNLETIVSLKEINPGVYFIQVGNVRITKKLVITK